MRENVLHLPFRVYILLLSTNFFSFKHLRAIKKKIIFPFFFTPASILLYHIFISIHLEK